MELFSNFQHYNIISELILLFIMLLLSAFFSAAETALVSMTKLKVKTLIEKEGGQLEAVNNWLKKPNRWLITVLVGNNLVNLYAASLMTLIVSKILGGTPGAEVAGIATGVIAFLILIFGEIFPKTYSRINAEKIFVLIIKPLDIISWLFTPIVYFLEGIVSILMKIFGMEHKSVSRLLITEEEIMHLLEVSQKEGLIKQDEKDMISSVFELRETQVKEIMVPRTEMLCLNVKQSFKENLLHILEAGHSKIPVYESNVDKIIGILYVRDLLYYWDKSSEINIKLLLRPAFFVPENKKVNTLLREFQQEKTHVAIVVDEYGGTSGMVTIVDLIEEIIWKIYDEYDKEVKKYEIKEDGTIIINASMNLEEANEELNINLPTKETYDTIGGFILDQLEHIPTKGEELLYNNLIIKVLIVEGGRMVKLQINKIITEEESHHDSQPY